MKFFMIVKSNKLVNKPVALIHFVRLTCDSSKAHFYYKLEDCYWGKDEDKNQPKYNLCIRTLAMLCNNLKSTLNA